MNFKSIFLPLIFLPDFQSSRSNAFFNSIVQFPIFRISWLFEKLTSRNLRTGPLPMARTEQSFRVDRLGFLFLHQGSRKTSDWLRWFFPDGEVLLAMGNTLALLARPVLLRLHGNALVAIEWYSAQQVLERWLRQ